MEKNKTCNRPWRYSLAMFGLSIAGYMYVTYGTFFYTETIGLSMKLIALGNVLYAVWDAFNDPIAGYLSDRTRTRWGRRKPWLLVSVPVFVLSSILFFSPPASLGTGVGLAVYFTVFLMLTETGNTISTVNYHSLLPELYRDEKRRNQANALRQAMQLVGMIIGVSLVPMITAAIGYRATALALGLSTDFFPWRILCSIRKPFSTFFMQIQFPWRFVGMAVPMLSAAAAWGYLREEKDAKTGMAALIALCVVFSGYTMQTMVQRLPELEKETYTDTRIGQFEYTYPCTEKTALKVGDVRTSQPGVCSVLSYEKRGTELTATVQLEGEAAYIELPLLYYPGYRAEIDGQAQTVARGTNNMVRVYGLSSGESGTVHVWYQPPTAWLIAQGASALGALLLAAAFIGLPFILPPKQEAAKTALLLLLPDLPPHAQLDVHGDGDRLHRNLVNHPEPEFLHILRLFKLQAPCPFTVGGVHAAPPATGFGFQNFVLLIENFKTVQVEGAFHPQPQNHFPHLFSVPFKRTALFQEKPACRHAFRQDDVSAARFLPVIGSRQRHMLFRLFCQLYKHLPGISGKHRDTV